MIDLDSPDVLEALSDKVHQAWMAEKQRQGFADHALINCWADRTQQLGECTHPFGPSGCHSNYCTIIPDKHHTDMLPYADLPEHIKEYDRATVRTVLAAIKELNIAPTSAPARQDSGRVA